MRSHQLSGLTRRKNAPYLFTQKIPDLELAAIFLDDAVDREVGIH